MSISRRSNLLFLGLTVMFLGYFMTWLPGPSAGLQIIGLELGEWIKFLGVGLRRNWFYFPPIVIGAIVALLAAMWPNGQLRTWLTRLFAVAIAMLSFPAIAAIQLEPRSEWLPRLIAIGVVAAIAIGGALVPSGDRAIRWIWFAIAIIAFLGGILPVAQYFSALPIVEGVLQRSLGAGLGVWLNLAGGVIVGSAALSVFLNRANKKDNH